MNYFPGGDLHSLIVRNKRFAEKQAKFYIAEIMLALNNLHQKNILYRDLKPENVLIDIDGHVGLGTLVCRRRWRIVMNRHTLFVVL